MRDATSKIHVSKLKALLEVSKALATEIHLESLLRVIVEKATEVLGAERSSLFLYDPERAELRSVVAEGVGSRELRFSANRGLAGYVATTRKPVNLSNAYDDARFNPDFDQQTGFRTRSVLCIPILDRNQQLIGVIQVLNKQQKGRFTSDDEALLESFCAHAAVALERAMLMEAYVEQQRMQESLKLAREIQMEMLPDPGTPSKHVDLYAHLEPVMAVGGDLYDFFRIDAHRIGVALGDVSGKGMPAALSMASIHALLRALGQQGLPPDQCLQHISQTQRLRPSTFVTLFYGVLDVRTGRVKLCNAGHNPPALLKHDGGVSFLPRARNLPICHVKDVVYEADDVVLDPGDGLFLYSDGLTEATGSSGSMFGAERLRRALEQQAGHTAEETVRAVRSALQVFTEGAQRDDVTMLALTYLGG